MPISTNFRMIKMSLTSQETNLKSYQKQAKEDVRAMMDNFLEIVRLLRVEPDQKSPRHNSTATRMEENYQLTVRSSNIVRAAQSIQRLIFAIKQFVTINDFPLINEAISRKSKFMVETQVNEVDAKLINLRDQISDELRDLEEDFYSSPIKY